jgi:hypothetical protein
MVSPFFRNSGYLMFRTPLLTICAAGAPHIPARRDGLSYHIRPSAASFPQKENRPFQAGFYDRSD